LVPKIPCAFLYIKLCIFLHSCRNHFFENSEL
jgi:hypothetical protein